MQRPGVARILKEILLCGKKTVIPSPPHSTENFDPDLELCIKNGWIYAELTDPGIATHDYIFASSLHSRYVQWHLCGSSGGSVMDKSVMDFALATIRHISPLSLMEKRHIMSSVQSVPEAQFQDEFYRACAAYTKNCVVSFPEFGTRRGRIDFFIPSKKWGIELLRNGDRLVSHVKRFTKGEYGKWITSGVMDDYVVLDFRPSKPRRSHNGTSPLFRPYWSYKLFSDLMNVYYIVYKNDWTEVEVYNNELEVVDRFVLSYAH